MEEIARSGPQSLAFGPLKPVGLVDPRSGERPYAVVQLRQDDLEKKFFQLVGFQTRLKHGEQQRIFRTLPGLERAEFERFGRMHRNTYINAPLIINRFSQSKLQGRVYFAGQISGVEGYVESVASGLACGLFAVRDALGLERQRAAGDDRHRLAAGAMSPRPTGRISGPASSPSACCRTGRGKPRQEEKEGAEGRKGLEAMGQWIKKTAI